jgi:hypothetical protein
VGRQDPLVAPLHRSLPMGPGDTILQLPRCRRPPQSGAPRPHSRPRAGG